MNTIAVKRDRYWTVTIAIKQPLDNGDSRIVTFDLCVPEWMIKTMPEKVAKGMILEALNRINKEDTPRLYEEESQ